MKITLSPSRLIGLRSPVVSSLPGSTAIKCIFSNDIRYNESFRGIAIQLVEKLFCDTQITCLFEELLLLELCVLSARQRLSV
jgi:hypothetical protein